MRVDAIANQAGHGSACDAGRSDPGRREDVRQNGFCLAPAFEVALLSYRALTVRDEAFRDEAARFLKSAPDAFERTNPEGHFTGSAVIVDRARQHVLLTLHAKLGRWLQLGGHCDGIRDPFFVAWKEAYEESGLKAIHPISDRIFDIGIHPIPAYGDVPSHLHYDIRHLFVADPNEPLRISAESKDLRWVPLSSFDGFVDESDLPSMRDKILSAKGEFQ